MSFVNLLSPSLNISLSSQTLEAFVRVLDYRQKLGGLIARLHAEYFYDEPAPFAGMPSTIIQQTQSQSIDIQMPEAENNETIPCIPCNGLFPFLFFRAHLFAGKFL